VLVPAGSCLECVGPIQTYGIQGLDAAQLQTLDRNLNIPFFSDAYKSLRVFGLAWHALCCMPGEPDKKLTNQPNLLGELP
jgi:hypothetical protein